MNSFKVFNGNEGEYDTRLDEARESMELPVGVNFMFVNFEDDVKIFKPSFRFFRTVTI